MEINNPYISVEISESQFASIKRSLKKELQLLIPNILDLTDPHITIAYILGKKNISDLEALAEEIAEGPFIMNVNGIKAFESTYYEGTVISLSLDHTDDFIYVQEFVKESVITDESVLIKEDYPGGFKAHLSLFVLKGLDEKTIELLPLYLETVLSKLNIKIKGEKFSIFNDQRQKLIEKNFNK